MATLDPPLKGNVDYARIMQDGAGRAREALISWLWEELVYAAHDAYRELTSRPMAIVRVQHGAFEYVYDDYASLEAQDLVPRHPTMEARLVIAIGRSTPRARARDDSRLSQWAGPNVREKYGPGWDRGHFMAYCLGGVVDGFEVNVFVQRTSLNRGWKSHAQGRLYRQMENYCAAHLGTFCFSRPIYGDETAKPTFIEFGILRPEGDLWVERFDNQCVEIR